MSRIMLGGGVVFVPGVSSFWASQCCKSHRSSDFCCHILICIHFIERLMNPDPAQNGHKPWLRTPTMNPYFSFRVEQRVLGAQEAAKCGNLSSVSAFADPSVGDTCSNLVFGQAGVWSHWWTCCGKPDVDSLPHSIPALFLWENGNIMDNRPKRQSTPSFVSKMVAVNDSHYHMFIYSICIS